MRRLFDLIPLIITLGFILTQPTGLTIAYGQQATAANLELANNSNQSIAICSIFAVLVKPHKVVLNLDEQITLAPGASKSFSVPPGQYRLLITDCGQNSLFQQSITLTNSYLVPLSTQSAANATSTASVTPNDLAAQCTEGIQLFREGKSEEALLLLEAGIKGRESATFATATDLANCALALGAVLTTKGAHDDALEALTIALETFRQAGNRIGESITLVGIGESYVAQKEYTKAHQTFRQALLNQQSLGNRAWEAHVRYDIGELYYKQGQFTQAMQSYQQALTIAQAAGNRAIEGGALKGIGIIYSDQGQYVKALENFQQALTINKSLGDRINEARTLHNIGATYEAQGQSTKALDILEQALRLEQKLNDRTAEGATLDSIGNIYSHQGQYAKSLEYHQRALTIAQAIGSQEGESKSLHNIGTVYNAQGQYAKALESLQQALTLQQTLGDQTNQGTTLNNIGNVYKAQGEYAKALESYKQALAVMRALGDRNGEGITLGNIGTVYDDQGQYTQALENFQKSLTIVQTMGNPVAEGNILNNIGRIYSVRGEYSKALDYHQRALIIAQAAGDRVSKGVILNNIGSVYHTQRQYDQALKYYTQAMDVLEEIRAIAGSEQGRSNFIDQYADLYARAAWLYHLQGRDDQAFFTVERGRVRAFLDSLATGIVQLSDQDADTLLKDEQESYSLRQATENALSRAHVANPPDPQLVASLEQQLKQAQQQHARAVALIEQRNDQLATLVPGRTKNILDLPAVQKLLGAQTTLIAYEIFADQTLAFIISPNHFQTVVISVTYTSLITQVQTLREFSDFSEAHPPSAVHLHRWLIAPIKPYLTTPHLLIVPNSMLHYLPFAALTDGKRFLIDDYTLTVLPSASTLQFIQPHPSLTNTVPLIVGNPATTEQPPLRYAEQEAQAIGTLFGVTPLLGKQATKAAVHSRITQASILHLAAHGRYNLYDPLESTIYLAPTSDGEDNGHLTVRDIYNWNLDTTNLVVLSACETQTNELSAGNIVSAGDEIVGLTRAFFFAGAPSVLATLWSVDDASSAQLMEHFYTNLRSGMGKAEALRQAQLAIRENYPNPYYWAGFVLSGDGGSLTHKPLKK